VLLSTHDHCSCLTLTKHAACSGDAVHLLAETAVASCLHRCVRRLPWRTPHPQLEALLNGLPSLTPGRGPPQLQYSAALLLSAYTPWLADHLAATGQAGSGAALLNR
jgi:hypothetical protein